MTRMDGLFYFFENRLWDLQRSRKLLYTLLAACAGAAVLLAVVFLLIVPNVQYSRAMGYVKNGDYASAVQIFKSLGDFKDSKEYTELYSLLSVEAGDMVVFGQYEQDGNAENGPEPVEWIALETDGSRVLLLSRYLLEKSAFSTEFGPSTWDISGARQWCNGTFYSTAFNDAEKDAIVLTHLEAPKNSHYPEMPAGEPTDDYVFLLSLEEAEKYFPNDEDKYTRATQYVKDQGAYVNSENGCSWWWLRTVGCDRSLATAVHAGYQIVFNVADFYGCNVNNHEGCLRPAIWVDTDIYAKELVPPTEG